MKKFIDERKRLTMKHYRQVELLKKVHQEQFQNFTKDNEKVGEYLGWFSKGGRETDHETLHTGRAAEESTSRTVPELHKR